MQLFFNIGECMTKLQSGRECVHNSEIGYFRISFLNQKRGDNSATGKGRVTVLAREIPLTLAII